MAQALSESMEDYLETIFLLIREQAVARSRDIAARMNVNKSSVTGALQALAERALVNYEPYGYVTLTRAGAAEAQRVLRRHEVLKDFLVKVLSVEEAEADANACRMEHAVSKGVVDRLVDFAEFVETCPRAGAKWIHGFGYRCREAIAAPEAMSCERCIAQCLDDVKTQENRGANKSVSTTLKELKPGDKARIEKLSGAGAVARRIADMGVTKGSVVEVIRIAPLGDPIDVKIKGYHLSLRKEEAAGIAVSRLPAK
ncbi:MAG: metal-dependent transcriptional regulator [Opitutae bacterium]|nr:metal-dependent transcriptional regulator [Opitutae bacterium]